MRTATGTRPAELTSTDTRWGPEWTSTGTHLVITLRRPEPPRPPQEQEGYAPHESSVTTEAGQGLYGHDYDRKEHHGVTGAVLHRSGSSSSSSSEDDGLGGRRKKRGLKGKIKEKLPGGTKTDTTYGGTGTTEQHHQEKGMVDKIKEKLPGTWGHRADDPYSSHTHTTATTTPYGGTANTDEHHEKKGIMDKIKEKFSGQHWMTG